MGRYRQNNIAIIRKKLGLSQEEMAAALGVSVKTILAWQYNWRQPGDANLKKIHDLWGYTPNQVIFYTSI